MSINNIKDSWNNGDYKNKMEYPDATKFKETHVFDEEKSVKWNKEKVIYENNLINESKRVYQEESNRLNRKLHDDAVNALIDEYSFNKAQAERIWSFAYSEKHSHMNDVFYFVIELADLAEDLITLNKS